MITPFLSLTVTVGEKVEFIAENAFVNCHKLIEAVGHSALPIPPFPSERKPPGYTGIQNAAGLPKRKTGG